MNVFVFDIETVPDVESGRRLHGLNGLSDGDVAKVMALKQVEARGNEFLPHYLHRVVAISAVFRHAERLSVWSLGGPEADEAELIERFFAGIERYTPTLVSWNGGGFDLPVLHYRALRHGIAAPRYWDTGKDDNSFRWNNYRNRFHDRHIDLMDVLAAYQPRASAPLDGIATMLGLPGKLGMHGSKVWSCFQAGEIDAIRDYCETDVLNTYIVFLRFQLLCGELDLGAYNAECERLQTLLAEEGHAHFREFLRVWQANA